MKHKINYLLFNYAAQEIIFKFSEEFNLKIAFKLNIFPFFPPNFSLWKHWL